MFLVAHFPPGLIHSLWCTFSSGRVVLLQEDSSERCPGESVLFCSVLISHPHHCSIWIPSNSALNYVAIFSVASFILYLVRVPRRKLCVQHSGFLWQCCMLFCVYISKGKLKECAFHLEQKVSPKKESLVVLRSCRLIWWIWEYSKARKNALKSGWCTEPPLLLSPRHHWASSLTEGRVLFCTLTQRDSQDCERWQSRYGSPVLPSFTWCTSHRVQNVDV